MLHLELSISVILVMQSHLSVLSNILAQSLNSDLNFSEEFLQASKESNVWFPGRSGTVQEAKISSLQSPRVLKVSAIRIFQMWK